MKPPPGNIPALDILRTAAILMVVAMHTQVELGSRLPLVGAGWSGVDLFFVLSGLLIGRQLWKQAEGGGIRIGQFLLRRGLRIWPLYFAVVAFVGVVLVGRTPWVDLLCVSNYFHHYVSGGWSLSTEEQFYLLAPLVLSLGPARRMVWAPIAALVVLPAVRWALIGTSHTPEAWVRIYAPMYSHADGLAVGLILAWATIYRPEWFKGRWWPSAVAAAVAFAALYQGGFVLEFSAWAALYGGLTVAALRWAPRGQGFYATSRLSYGVYLVHPYIVDRVGPVVGRYLGVGVGAFGVGLAVVGALSLAVAFGTYRLVEEPFLMLRDNILKVPPRRAYAKKSSGAV